MKPSFNSDLEIAAYEQAVAVNLSLKNNVLHVGILFIDRLCPALITLGDVTVTLPPESVNQRNPQALTEIDLEIYTP